MKLSRKWPKYGGFRFWRVRKWVWTKILFKSVAIVNSAHNWVENFCATTLLDASNSPNLTKIQENGKKPRNLDYGRYQCRIESPMGNHGWHQCDKPRLVKSIQFRCANTLSLGIITKIQESPKSRSVAFWDFTFLHPYWARTMTILFGNILYLICGY